MNISLILLVVLTIARLWIALQLFLTARKSRLNNLYWLAAVFALAVYSIFTPVAESPLGNYWLFDLGFIAGHFCLAMFIHTTFHRDRKSPVAIILGLAVLAFCVDIYALANNDTNLAGLMTIVGLVNWIWHLVVAQSAYATISADPAVERWVKARYRLMIVYVVMMILITTQVLFSSTNLSSLVPAFVLPIGLLVILASIILQFLVWVMPEPFRLWLNREQQPGPAEEEDRTLSIMSVFGAAMTADTGLQRIACLYAIRSAVAKRIDSEDSAAARAYINTMSFQEWDLVLQHSELRRVLLTGADEAAVNKAIANARTALVEKQSLITLSAQ